MRRIYFSRLCQTSFLALRSLTSLTNAINYYKASTSAKLCISVHTLPSRSYTVPHDTYMARCMANKLCHSSSPKIHFSMYTQSTWVGFCSSKNDSGAIEDVMRGRRRILRRQRCWPCVCVWHHLSNMQKISNGTLMSLIATQYVFLFMYANFVLSDIP